MTTSRVSSASGDIDELVRANLATLDAQLARAGTSRTKLRVVAVTKTMPAAYVDAAARAGLTCVGENYAQELLTKRAQCTVAVRWHFLGTLQSNKIASLARQADLLASVARTKEISVLARQEAPPPIYLEIDFTGDPSRNGASVGEIETLLECARTHNIEVRGLMTVAPPDPTGAEQAFAALALAADTFQLTERSMGMSDDWERAVQHGSTEIRIGRALFGPRLGR